MSSTNLDETTYEIEADREEKVEKEEIKIVVTKHAKERYAERIMSKSDKLEINKYIAENEDKIVENITKMVKYGKIVYSGNNPRKDKNGSTNKVNIYANKAWVLILSAERNEVITLFKVDLGLDDDFNNLYVEKVMAKLVEQQKILEETQKQVIDENKNIRRSMEENNDKIKAYKRYTKQLEDANEGYKAIIAANLIKVSEAEDELANILEKIVSKNKY